MILKTSLDGLLVAPHPTVCLPRPLAFAVVPRPWKASLCSRIHPRLRNRSDWYPHPGLGVLRGRPALALSGAWPGTFGVRTGQTHCWVTWRVVTGKHRCRIALFISFLPRLGSWFGFPRSFPCCYCSKIMTAFNVKVQRVSRGTFHSDMSSVMRLKQPWNCVLLSDGDLKRSTYIYCTWWLCSQGCLSVIVSAFEDKERAVLLPLWSRTALNAPVLRIYRIKSSLNGSFTRINNFSVCLLSDSCGTQLDFKWDVFNELLITAVFHCFINSKRARLNISYHQISKLKYHLVLVRCQESHFHWHTNECQLIFSSSYYKLLISVLERVTLSRVFRAPQRV